MIVVLAHALLHFLWQGIVLGLVFAALGPLRRRCQASTCYLVELALLLAAPMMVIVTLAVSLSASRPSPFVGIGVPGPPPGWAMLVAGIWLVGSSSLALHTGLALVQLRRLRATGLPLRGLQATADCLRARLRVGVRVSVAESPAVASPLVTGVLRPMILLPLGMVGRMPPAWIEALLAHELAHVRRYDVLLGIVQRVVEILLFFHPVVWWISSELRHTRERACDDLVVDALHAPLDYARALTELASAPAQTPALAMGARRGRLMSRIHHIVQRTPRPLRRPPRLAPLAGGLTLAIAFAVGCLAHHDTAAESVEPPPAAAEASAPVASTDDDAAASNGLSIAWLPDSVRRFEHEIVDAAARHHVDPNLVAILVMVESNGNPDARSPAGARGLMQVMPATAVGIAQERGLAEPVEADLDDPVYNLDLGTWFLARQLADFGDGVDEDESVARAAAAYNGGPKRFAASLRGEAELSEETQRYREIVRTLWAARDDAQRPGVND